MRDWVNPLRRLIRPKSISPECYEEQSKESQFVWQEIADLFLHEFGPGDFDLILGSVICDIPKEAFDKLFEAYPFFVLAKGAAYCQMINGAGRANIPLVIFLERELKDMNFSERRGVVSHEIAHIVAGHLERPFSLDDPYGNKKEEEADALCREWGLGSEIESIRNYISQKGKKNHDR
jgi:hypothetical protein